METRLQENFPRFEPTEVSLLDTKLHQSFRNRIILDNTLNRSIVSFQANKKIPGYKWYKYKEGFSSILIEKLMDRYKIDSGPVLDPFAGSGTALFVSALRGIDSEGIELLPIGQEIIKARELVEKGISEETISKLSKYASTQPWAIQKRKKKLNTLRITRWAYPRRSEQEVEKFMEWANSQNGELKILLNFALLCVLENISYTRKDGQYLRWDSRAPNRKYGGKFLKGPIPPFRVAIKSKILDMVADIWTMKERLDGDLESKSRSVSPGKTTLHSGSVLDILPTLDKDRFGCVFTSPPYCNRYDYTRTYALELALLGISEEGLSKLRQSMVSCTVENRAKDLLQMNSSWKKAIDAADSQTLLQAIIRYLEEQKDLGNLNNNGIPRMVKGYFYELACVVQECYRVMRKNGRLFMVNDNVRYAGISISVDLILSDLARMLGFEIENILVLPLGKGNSSQQMGEHGREAMRKCVYVWRKP